MITIEEARELFKKKPFYTRRLIKSGDYWIFVGNHKCLYIGDAEHKWYMYSSVSDTLKKVHKLPMYDISLYSDTLREFWKIRGFYFYKISATNLIYYSLINQLIDSGVKIPDYIRIAYLIPSIYDGNYFESVEYFNKNIPLYKKIPKKFMIRIKYLPNEFLCILSFINPGFYLSCMSDKDLINKMREHIVNSIIDPYYSGINLVSLYTHCMGYCLQDFHDYLRLLKSIPKDRLKNKYTIDPPASKLAQYHDELIDIQNSIQFEKDEKLNEEWNKVNEKLRFLEFSNSDYSLILPETPNLLRIEGQKLHHCVGSYINSILDKCDIILFLRRNANVDEPFITVNLDYNGNIRQIHGMCNNDIGDHKDSIQIFKFLNEWISQNDFIKDDLSKHYGLKCAIKH